MYDTGLVSGVSVSHERATLDDIDAAGPPSTEAALRRLLDRSVDEAFVLGTCNRVEAYVVTDDADRARRVLGDLVGEVPERAVRWLGHEESLRHLMRVAAGLESMVVGEDQILGQVRAAVETARSVGAVGDQLDEALGKALHVGERARDETAINEGVVSLGSAAVRLAGEERRLDGATAVVVGAGEMARLAAKAFDDRVGKVVLLNRSPERAAHVADSLDVDAEAANIEALPEALAAATVAVTATGSDDYVMGRPALSGAGETFVVDLARPRDVAPGAAALPAVEVRDLDDLEDVRDETFDHRRAAAEEVEAMIDAEFDHLMTRYKRKRADRVVAAMHRGADRVKREELQRALADLERAGDLSDEQREVVESLADALVSQLLAAPTKSLRDAAEEDDWSTIHAALQLFDPSGVAAPEFADDGPAELPESVRAEMPPAVREQLATDED